MGYLCKKISNGEVCYDCIHSWLRREFGNADKCVNCFTKTAKRYDYCLLKGKQHKRDRQNYIQLCMSCHRAYDYDERKKKLSHKNFKHSIETKKKMSISKINYWKNL